MKKGMIKMSLCKYCSYMNLSDQNKYGECYCSYWGRYYDPNSNGCNHNDNSTDGREDTGGCYLTTAMCGILGKADDCYELETLRKFREKYMRNTDEGRLLLKEYDIISPPMALELSKHENRMTIAHEMLHQFINPAIELINNDENALAIKKYKSMVMYVKSVIKSDR